MTKFDRIYDLYAVFNRNRYGLSTSRLTELLECSPATVKRLVRKLRDEYNAPLRYDRKYGGYVLDKSEEQALQLPGLWFNVSELHSLLTIQELLNQLQPGLLKTELESFRNRIRAILSSRQINSSDLHRRIRFAGIGERVCCPMHFKVVARATMERLRLSLHYHSRSKDQYTSRTVSPQQLIYYRGNWYLAAWCHTRKGLRTMALDRIQEARLTKDTAREIDEKQLDQYFNQSFGIFTGPPKNTAVLNFSPERARWVAEENWHPAQQGRYLGDGSYELRIPYSDQRELIMEILKYGPDVEVIAPDELRQQVGRRILSAAEKYERNE
jgi:proteasome accessory factor C